MLGFYYLFVCFFIVVCLLLYNRYLIIFIDWINFFLVFRKIKVISVDNFLSYSNWLEMDIYLNLYKLEKNRIKRI